MITFAFGDNVLNGFIKSSTVTVAIAFIPDEAELRNIKKLHCLLKHNLHKAVQ